MDQAWDRAHGPRPSIASVPVRALSWQPRPQSKAPGSRGGSHSGRLPEEHLSPARLQALAQVDDLRLVSVLELCVNTHENSLGNFGLHLPNLSQLKLNGSCLGSLRDLGTSLGRLQVLWLARCGLADLDGIGSFPALKVPQGYNYRAEVRKLVPQLQVLDELPATHTRLTTSRKLDHDWLVVKEAIKEGSVLDSLLPGLGSPHGSPVWRCSPELCSPETQRRAPRPWPCSLLVPGGPLPAGLLPQGPAPQDDASSLTHGAGRVLCGNPAKGLQERRHQCQAGAHPERLPPPGPEDLAARASAPGPDPADSRHLLASASLPALRELRLRPLPSRCLESREEAAAAPGGPQRGPEEEQDEAGPTTRPRPPSLAPEPSRTLGYNLTPSPPKSLMPSDRGSSSWGSTDLQFRGRHLRALGSLGPGLGQGLAAVTALRALEVASGPSPRAEGCPGPKPAPDPAARPPASSACRT
ncbi:leucine-rich repeat-containing protein 56 isoform X4 [Lagenorhynchus albirostris]|uniref:leucine-rich repeat-containing protein 56 isoform X4 n=1 Tax=Lagenorhynchus albirostris TaxID=27610 RepID=UPI0028EC7707|nr:leucine-rich repeat-containing protein 56 isoform X4 [Lagenorhynchus albirostris]